MDLIFADDARQPNPSRARVGPLVAIGGIHVAGTVVGPLERAIADLCRRHGFPDHQQFKWSPGKRENHMRENLVGDKRVRFYEQLLQLASTHESKALIVVESTSRKPARKSSTNHEDDVTALFLERCQSSLLASKQDGLAVVAVPSGGSKSDGKFVAHCIELRNSGTEYSRLDRLPLGVVTMPSRHARLLQLADVVVSCTTARVSGESNYSPPVFEMLKPLFRRHLDRIGGVGVKLHPDLVFANLYHWLFGDTHSWKGNVGDPLPIRGLPFFSGPEEGTASAPSTPPGDAG